MSAFETKRYELRAAIIEGGDQPAPLIAGGFYSRRDGPALKSIFIGTKGSGPEFDNGSITFKLQGSRNGAYYERTFSLAVGQDCVIDGEALEDLNLSIVAFSGGNNVTVAATGSDKAPVSASVRPLARLMTFPVTPAVMPVPAGASHIVAYQTLVGFQWIMYDGAGAAVVLSETIGAGVVTPVKGTHYRGVSELSAVWQVQP